MNKLYVNICKWITKIEFDTDNKLVLFGVRIIDKLLVCYEKIGDKFNLVA